MAFSFTVPDVSVFKRDTEDYFVPANEDGCFRSVSFECYGRKWRVRLKKGGSVELLCCAGSWLLVYIGGLHL